MDIDVCNDDRDGAIVVVTHAQGEALDTMTPGQCGPFAMEHNLALAGQAPPHFDGAPVARRLVRLQRLEDRLLGREPNGEPLGGRTSGRRTAIGGFVGCEQALYRSVCRSDSENRTRRLH